MSQRPWPAYTPPPRRRSRTALIVAGVVLVPLVPIVLLLVAGLVAMLVLRPDEPDPEALATHSGPGFFREIRPHEGTPPKEGVITEPGLITGTFRIRYPTTFTPYLLSWNDSSGWELRLPDHPGSSVRVRRYDNEESGRTEYAAGYGAEGDRLKARDGEFPGYEPGVREAWPTPVSGMESWHRTARFHVAGKPAQAEQWYLLSSNAKIVTLTVVVVEGDDPAPYHQLVRSLVDGDLQVTC